MIPLHAPEVEFTLQNIVGFFGIFLLEINIKKR